jgi:hypothetical protein
MLTLYDHLVSILHGTRYPEYNVFEILEIEIQGFDIPTRNHWVDILTIWYLMI